MNCKKLVFAVRSRRTSLRIDSGRSTVILNSGIVILYCHSERNTVILNEVKNLVREPGVENRWGAPDPSLTLRMTERTHRDSCHTGSSCP